MSQPLDLAVVGNSTIAALIDPRGRHVWWCFPRLDGDPVFCALLGGAAPETGFMDVTLDGMADSRQSYIRNTAALVTELTDERGNRLRITDFAPRFRRFGRMFRPPMLVRRIEPLAGRCRIRVRIRPRFDWGGTAAECRIGSHHLRYVTPGETLRVSTDAPVSFVAEEVAFVLERPIHLVLGPDETLPQAPADMARDYEEQTIRFWQDWTRFLSVPFEWQEAVIRAAITLKLSSFEDSGGVVAALTTSIPEAPNSGRNWDYRFCWLRDAFFTVLALNRLGATRTMEEYVGYLFNVVITEPDAPLRPVYPIVPGMAIAERLAPALPGYLGDGPVRVGNAAADQVQNDVYGSVILAAAQMFYDERLPRAASLELFRQLEGVGRVAERVALTPDASLWEYRGRSSVHTFSAAMCAAGLHRLSRIAARLGQIDDAGRWQAAADRIRAEVLRRAYRDDLGSFVESLDGEGMDAALLLLPEIGFISATDPRFVATVAAAERRLRRNGLLLRYDRADDFGPPETAFTVCTFWYVDALAALGRRDEARALFEQVLARRNHVGLLSEDIDPRTGQLWGNFPQTYSLVGLILSAMRLSRSWEEGFWRD